MVNTEIRLIIFFAVEDGETVYSQKKTRPGLQLTKTSLLTNTIFQLSPSYLDFLLLTDLPSHTHNCDLIASKNIWKWLQLKTCMCVHVHILPKFPCVSIMNIIGMQCAQKNIPPKEKDSDFVLEIVFFRNWEINTISTLGATRLKSSSWFWFWPPMWVEKKNFMDPQIPSSNNVWTGLNEYKNSFKL